MTGERFQISSGEFRAIISEVGAGLAGLWHGLRAVTVSYPDTKLPPMSNGAVLIPWPNRIRDGVYAFEGAVHKLPLSEPANHNASHGLVRWERWSVAERTESAITMTLDIVPQTGYEFELRAELSYALDAAAGLTVSLRVINLGVTNAPFGAGFHPYLDLSGHHIDNAEIQVPAATVLLTDERQIPTGGQLVYGTPYDLNKRRPIGTLRLDHGYGDLTGSRALVSIAGAITELWWDANYKYLQVFTPPIERFGCTAIAIEPMTCPANAFNSGDGLIVLAPAEMFSARWGIAVSGEIGSPE